MNTIINNTTGDKEKISPPECRSYPVQYVKTWILKDNTPVLIRPIRLVDELMMVRFHKELSDESVYFRYFHPISLAHRISHERLEQICAVDYNREMVLVTVHKNQDTKNYEIIAVGRLSKYKNDAEFAIIVSDRYQYFGLGTELLRRLIQYGRDEKLDHIIGYILPDNIGMQRVCEKLGFELHYDFEEKAIIANLSV